MSERRNKIIIDFTRWAATAAAKQGVQSRGRVWYEHIDSIDLDSLFGLTPPVSQAEFDSWHEHEVTKLAEHAGVPIGWAAKIVNMTTKIRIYLAGQGDPSLQEVIHPPIDNQIVRAIKDRYPIKGRMRDRNKELRRLCDLGKPISGITSYNQYRDVMRGFGMVAAELGCSVFEVESLWPG